MNTGQSVVFDTVFDYTCEHEAATAAPGGPAGAREHPVTEIAPASLAARRRRAVAGRSATLAVAAGPEVADPAGVGRTDLVVLLPSTDAATVLLLCEEAAELSG
jgi:hypothetical protein